MKLSVKNGELHFRFKGNEQKFKNFLKSIPDDANLDLFISVSTEKGTNAQLAKIHAMCRELANGLGYTFEEIKLTVKRKAGLCFTKNNVEYCKSFADCDKDDLNLVIQACIEIGDFNEMNLR
jgi:hypothetical protein